MFWNRKHFYVMQAVMVLFFGAFTVWQSEVFVFRSCWINIRSQRNGEILILSPILQAHHKHSWTLLLNQNLRIQLREIPHNMGGSLTDDFQPSAVCKFLDLPPVSLRNFASKPAKFAGHAWLKFTSPCQHPIVRYFLRECCDQFWFNRNQFHLMYPDTKNGATLRMPRLTSEWYSTPCGTPSLPEAKHTRPWYSRRHGRQASLLIIIIFERCSSCQGS